MLTSVNGSNLMLSSVDSSIYYQMMSSVDSSITKNDKLKLKGSGNCSYQNYIQNIYIFFNMVLCTLLFSCFISSRLGHLSFSLSTH